LILDYCVVFDFCHFVSRDKVRILIIVSSVELFDFHFVVFVSRDKVRILVIVSSVELFDFHFVYHFVVYSRGLGFFYFPFSLRQRFLRFSAHMFIIT